MRDLRYPVSFLAGVLLLSAPASRAAEHASSQPDDAWRSSFAVQKSDLASTGEAPYFVLEPGRRLHFQHGKTTLVVSVLDDTLVVDGVETRVVEEREERDGQPTEVSRNYIAIDRTTKDLYYFGEDSAEYRNGKVVGHDGSWRAGVAGARFGLWMPATVKVGDRYYQEFAPEVAMDRAEVVAVDGEVTTPAGTYKGCVHVRETSPLEKGASDKWYAPGVGLLRDDDFVLVKVAAAPARAASAAGAFEIVSVALPEAPPDGVMLDYLAVDRARHRVWVPAGGTGSADVIDVATQHLSRVEGFPTAEVERRGKKRRVGPSSATVGDGVVYVGNRGDSSVCAVDATTLTKSGCVTVPSMPDGIAFIARTKEVWVTTPRDQSLVILDVSSPTAPKIAGAMKLEGDPEGYAVDQARALFYTNLEDKDRTLRIDVATRKVTATWMPECGEAGPRGLAIDPAGKLLMVACPDHVEVLDAGKDGAILSRLDTGEGVDSLDYLPVRHALYVAAAGAATLTIASVDEKGQLQSIAVGATAKGARNAVVTEEGVVYVADGPEGKVLVVKTSAAR